MFDVRGAIAVVTGASSGLGRQFALDLATAGAVVVGLARREELLAQLETELKRSSPKSSVMVCDVSDTTRFATALAAIENEHGRIDLLVNNAGIGEPRDEPSRGITAYRTVMETNYFAVVAGTLAVLPGMMERRHGAIVNVSSDSGRAPSPGEASYSASKAALSAFTEAISFDAEKRGVHLHVLYPGWVPTAMGSGAIDAGMPTPPKMVRRTAPQVSRLMLARLGGSKVDIDAAPIAKLAPVARALFPRGYRQGIRRASG